MLLPSHPLLIFQEVSVQKLLSAFLVSWTRLRVFECRVLRRIFGPKRDEVTGEWRRLHFEELHKLYSSSNIRQNKSRRGQGMWHAWE
jgi:hypothetical protein